jgi:Ca2+-binding EF-hand superfamily protein
LFEKNKQNSDMGASSSDNRSLLNEYTAQYWKSVDGSDITDLSSAQDEISRLRTLIRLMDTEKVRAMCPFDDEIQQIGEAGDAKQGDTVVNQEEKQIVRDKGYADILITTLRFKMEERFKSLHESFLALDLDRTGFIKKEEFKSACFRWGVMIDRNDFEYLHSLFKAQGEVDSNDKGIDYGEFISLMTQDSDYEPGQDGHNGWLAHLLRKKVMDGHATMRQAFREADVTRSGDLNKREVRRLLESFHIECSDSEFDAFFDDYDRSHDGTFSYGEFVHLMQQPATDNEKAYREYLCGNRSHDNISDLLGAISVRSKEGHAGLGLPSPPASDRGSSDRVSASHRAPVATRSAVGNKHDGAYGARLLAAMRSKMEARFGSLNVTFHQLDANRSGFVSRHEFERACAAWGLVLDAGDYRLIHSMYPHPETDGVNYAEFVALMTGEEVRAHKSETGDSSHSFKVAETLRGRLMDGHHTMRQAFQRADVSGTGTLTKEEVRGLLKSFHIDCSHDEFDAFFDDYDRSGDGTFSYGEFVKLLQLPDSNYY